MNSLLNLQRWISPTLQKTSINTFLTHFLGKYAEDFQFNSDSVFGDTNPPVVRKVNFMKMTSDAIEAMTETELRVALVGRGVDASEFHDKKDLVNKALNM